MSQPTTPERNRAQVREEDRQQQAQVSPDARRVPTHVPAAVQPEVQALNVQNDPQNVNTQPPVQRRVRATRLRNAANTANPQNEPTRAQLAQRARRARERAEQEEQVAQLAQDAQREAPDPNPAPQQNLPVANREDILNQLNNPHAGDIDHRNDIPDGQEPVNDQALPPAELHEAEVARIAAKEKRNRVVAQLSRAGRHKLGLMNIRCPNCQAWHWNAERVKPRNNPGAILFGMCCVSGQIALPPPKCPPRELWELFTGAHYLSDNFHKNIRAINASLAFTSFGATRIGEMPAGQGPYIFKIGGEVHHLSGMLDQLPEGQHPQYAQLYLYDPADAANYWNQNPHNAAIDPGLMRLLTGVIHESHGYAALYKQAWQRIDEVALILPDQALNQQRDIVLFKQDGGFQRIDPWNPAYACLHYVLLFPKGEHGFQRHIPTQGRPWQQGLHPQAAQRAAQLEAQGHDPEEEEEVPEEDAPAGNRRNVRRVVSEREYYAYYLFSREEPNVQLQYPGANGVFSTIFRAGRLFQQYLVDIWAIADQSKLLWLCNNQAALRVDLYSGLCNALLNDNLTHREQVGRVILPSTYYGGSRQMAESYQDAMAISRYLGGPQLFITMTANPKWPEIRDALLPGQTHSDRPDLITQVFELKQRQLMEDITQKGVFGKCIAHVYTIEFQKRGLPHMHLLVWLERASHILDPGDVDELICAELPIAEGPGADAELYETVTSSMLHGPCGPEYPNAPCWDKQKKACTKGFYPLKQWNAQTRMVADSYPLYRRRDNGQTFKKTIGGVEITFDNRHVVPYNIFLSKKYNCHINVETCSGIGAIKFVFKYVYKGSDWISIELIQHTGGDPQPGQNLDEISAHLDARWVSPYEALWRLWKFYMHREVPNIVWLQVHLPEQQSVSFRAGQLIENVIANAKDTSLTAFFKLNSHADAQICTFANELVYQEIPSRFRWITTTRKFTLRKFTQINGGVKFSSGAIGQMYFAPPNSGERFYLRTLLTVVRGPTSFENLRTFEGQVFPTFKEACIAQGLLESDEEWARCLTEAAQYKTGKQMRRLFVVILTACLPTQPAQLWQQFCAQICDDLRFRLSQEPWNRPNPSDEDVYDFGLYLIEILVLETGSNMRDVNLPSCTQNWDEINQEQNRLIREQYALRDEQQEGLEDELQALLNNEQRAAFNRVLASVQNDLGTTFFLDGPAGTGKTFLYRTLCATLRAQGKIVICVASSGLAALLLPGGKTSHSVFKIPIEIKEDSTCNIPKWSNLAALIARTDLIIWDEVPMQHRFCAEAFNRTCKDIARHPNKAFGGITVVFGGDFRQTLPIVPRGTPEQIVAACLKESPLWAGMEKMKLIQNMRLQGDPEMAEFATWLLEVGEGDNIPRGTDSSSITFKRSMLVNDRDTLINRIYGLLDQLPNPSDEYFRSRTILTPRNDDVLILNQKILRKFPGEMRVFHSADKVIYEAGVDDERLGTLSAEYLNSLNSGSVPLSKLELKEGCPVMILCNLACSQGVCNGTRGIITRMGTRVLELRLLSGSEAGNTVFIPRISLTPPETEFGFQLSWQQFPV